MRRLSAALGSGPRAWAIVLLAATLAISDADLATVGAVAGELERHLHISDVQVGVLATATAVVGAVATIPVGNLTDRVPRVSLLTVSVVLWAGAMVVTALSTSYEMLLFSRMALGVVTATSGPTLASLTGDLFPAQERATVYGWIQSGEMGGAAVGLVAGGAVAGLVSWRASFLMLAAPALLLALGLWRKLPEPPRGGMADHPAASDTPLADADPATRSLAAAVRYVLSIPTNRVLIIASSLGYFFFTGVQTFAVVLLRRQFGVSQTAASGLIAVVAIGAVLGVLVGGRIADWRMASGHARARVSVGAGCYLLAVALLVPAFITTALALALPLFVIGAAAITAANPPLDAARLDVVPDFVWGRAEGVRTAMRQAATAAAPVGFGLVAGMLGGQVGLGTSLAGGGSVRSDLPGSFLVMLVTLLLSALILGRGRRCFPHDVAAAQEASRAAHRSTA